MRKPARVDERYTPLIQMLVDSLPVPYPIKGYAVDQRRGRAYYRNRTVTIPVWAIEKNKEHPYYLIWYVCHEVAHHIAWATAYHGKHGPEFMKALKEICPPHAIHYELGYKPRSAKAAGISNNNGE